LPKTFHANAMAMRIPMMLIVQRLVLTAAMLEKVCRALEPWDGPLSAGFRASAPVRMRVVPVARRDEVLAPHGEHCPAEPSGAKQAAPLELPDLRFPLPPQVLVALDWLARRRNEPPVGHRPEAAPVHQPIFGSRLVAEDLVDRRERLIEPHAATVSTPATPRS
jgi:hypothetical protein